MLYLYFLYNAQGIFYRTLGMFLTLVIILNYTKRYENYWQKGSFDFRLDFRRYVRGKTYYIICIYIGSIII